MVSRRIIREKVLQTIYSFEINDSRDFISAEKQLEKSIHELYGLFIYLLSFYVELVNYAQKRIGESQKKLVPTNEDLHPNKNFIQNRFYLLLRASEPFQKQLKKRKITWHTEPELFRDFYLEVQQTDLYKKYMSEEKHSFKQDKILVADLFKNLIVDNQVLRSILEEKSIFWTDDYETGVMMVVKAMTFHDWKKNSFPALFRNEEIEYEKFGKELLRKCMMKSAEYDAMIEEHLKNWDYERIALMDILIIKAALTEFTEFQSIPTKVTLNEYIEIAKLFSTPKSKVFINGILDKLLHVLQKEGKIQKTGRGLFKGS